MMRIQEHVFLQFLHRSLQIIIAGGKIQFSILNHYVNSSRDLSQLECHLVPL